MMGIIEFWSQREVSILKTNFSLLMNDTPITDYHHHNSSQSNKIQIIIPFLDSHFQKLIPFYVNVISVITCKSSYQYLW